MALYGECACEPVDKRARAPPSLLSAVMLTVTFNCPRRYQQEEDIIRRRFLTQTAVVTTTGPPFVQLVDSVRRRLSGARENPDAVDAPVAADEINQILYGIEAYINKLEMTTSANEKEQEVYRE